MAVSKSVESERSYVEREQIKEDVSCDKVKRISNGVFRPEGLQDGGPRRNAEKNQTRFLSKGFADDS
jgi:hypothetical protein